MTAECIAVAVAAWVIVPLPVAVAVGRAFRKSRRTDTRSNL